MPIDRSQLHKPGHPQHESKPVLMDLWFFDGMRVAGYGELWRIDGGGWILERTVLCDEFPANRENVGFIL
jgi:hypothetical protein